MYLLTIFLYQHLINAVVQQQNQMKILVKSNFFEQIYFIALNCLRFLYLFPKLRGGFYIS